MSEPLYHVLIEERATARGWTLLDNLHEQALRRWVVEPYNRRRTVEAGSLHFGEDQIVRVGIYRSGKLLSELRDFLTAFKRIPPDRTTSDRDLVAGFCEDVTDQYIAPRASKRVTPG